MSGGGRGGPGETRDIPNQCRPRGASSAGRRADHGERATTERADAAGDAPVVCTGCAGRAPGGAGGGDAIGPLPARTRRPFPTTARRVSAAGRRAAGSHARAARRDRTFPGPTARRPGAKTSAGDLPCRARRSPRAGVGPRARETHAERPPTPPRGTTHGETAVACLGLDRPVRGLRRLPVRRIPRRGGAVGLGRAARRGRAASPRRAGCAGARRPAGGHDGVRVLRLPLFVLPGDAAQAATATRGRSPGPACAQGMARLRRPLARSGPGRGDVRRRAPASDASMAGAASWPTVFPRRLFHVVGPFERSRET